MKSAKLWLFLAVVGLAIASAFPRGNSAGGGGAALSALSVAESPKPASTATPRPQETPNPLRQHWRFLQPNLVQYETQRINRTIIAAQAQAIQEGKQPLDIIRQWQRRIANDYLFEVQYGAGPESQKLKQDLITRYSYTVIAESVLLNKTPMQAVTIDEKAIACNMARHLGNGFGEGYCDAGNQQQ